MFDYKIVGFVIVFLSLAFFLRKELTKNKKEAPKKEKNANAKVEEEIPADVEKMLNLISALPNRDDGGEIDHSSLLVAENLNSNFKATNEIEGTTFINNDLYKRIVDDLGMKLGPSLAPLVRRVDDDGCIILDMEAIKFITGEHIPIITPSGAIRVMNFLSVEQEMEMAIATGKPVFFRSQKTNKIEKLTREQIDKLVLVEDLVGMSNTITENKDRLNFLSEENTILYERARVHEIELREAKELNVKYQNQLELLLSMSSKIPEVKKEVIQNPEPIIELRTNEKKLNLITQKNSKEVFNKAFSFKNILSSSFINNVNTQAVKLTFISSTFKEFVNEFTLSFAEDNFFKEVRNILKEEGYLFEQDSIDILFADRKTKRFVAYFTDRVDKKVYSTSIFEIVFKEDELLGLMIPNTRYSEVFTKEEAVKKLETEQRDSYKKMYKRRIQDITNGEYDVF